MGPYLGRNSLAILCKGPYGELRYSISLIPRQLIFAQNILQAPAVFFAKASILFLYLRVFTVKRSMRYFIYGGIVFTTALYWVHVPLVGYFCTPRNGGWSLMNMLKCTKLTVWGPIQGFCALMLDIYIFILPFPVVNQLHLQHKKKIGVMLLFSTAVL